MMSRSTTRVLSACACALALVANAAPAAVAQQEQRPARQKEQAVRIELTEQERVRAEREVGAQRDHFMITQGGEMQPGTVVLGQPADGVTFTYLSSELAFESKVVPGAPYSAEAVSESVQVLSDGNRITRRTTAKVYRDSEGRTRRDQTSALGPFATSEEQPQTVFINDPVAGVNYVLNTRTRTAHKGLQYAFATRARAVEGQEGASKQSATVTLRSTEGGAAQMAVTTPSGERPISAGVLNTRAKTRVQPVYPAVAKAAKAEGRVVVEVVVSESGQIESARAIEGHPLLQQAAVDAARQWEFAPTMLQGRPVKVSGRISFNFTLSKQEPPAGLGDAARAAVEGQHVEPMRMRVGGVGHELPDLKGAVEKLGRQSFDGVEAEGTRTTVTIPAGSIGNERPIQIVSERWYSPELQTVVMSRHSDPRFGETTYRLTNISRSEPDRSLFEVPAGYTISNDGPFERRLLPARRPKTDQ